MEDPSRLYTWLDSETKQSLGWALEPILNDIEREKPAGHYHRTRAHPQALTKKLGSRGGTRNTLPSQQEYDVEVRTAIAQVNESSQACTMYGRWEDVAAVLGCATSTARSRAAAQRVYHTLLAPSVPKH